MEQFVCLTSDLLPCNSILLNEKDTAVSNAFLLNLFIFSIYMKCGASLKLEGTVSVHDLPRHLRTFPKIKSLIIH